MKSRLVLVPLISALFLTIASCKQTFLTSDGLTWGTNYHIVYSSDHDLSDSIIAVMQEIDATLSMFNPSSEVSRINRNESDIPGPMFRNVFSIAKNIWKISGGMYDPTIGNASQIWGFGDKDIIKEPSDSLIEETLKTIGLGECEIDPSGTLKKKHPATRFDFSSIAKGYGIDCIGAMLERNGVKNYMIEIGGEILLLGLNPRNQPWRIQIDAPLDTDSAVSLHNRYTVMELGPSKTAVASSGNYRNFRRTDKGEKYGHTLSPLTGRPVHTEVLATTVVAPDCATADALATACMTLPPETSLAVLDSLGYSGLVIIPDAQKDFRTYFTRKKAGHL